MHRAVIYAIAQLSCFFVVLVVLTYNTTAVPNCRNFRVWNSHGHVTTLPMAIFNIVLVHHRTFLLTVDYRTDVSHFGDR